jgi:YesN/AraC family two-component response regulator
MIELLALREEPMPPVRGEKSSMLPLMRQGADGQTPVFTNSYRRSPPSRQACPRLEGDSMATAPRNILSIDDDSTVQEMLSCFLGDGYRVQRAATGAEALGKLRRESVDLVVLDHRLPGRTGLEILPEVRLIRPKVPVIMLTGYGSEWICAAAFKLGIADYLQKPVRAGDLVAAVQRILSAGPGKGEPPSESLMPAGGRAPLCMPVEKVIGLIQHRYWEHFSLSTLAHQVGMSKCRLSHRFHEVLGVTFRDYLLGVRLERAKALLAAGHVSITEVAQSVGFSDLPRFDKVFKRSTGLTPSAYRSSSLRTRKCSATNNY